MANRKIVLLGTGGTIAGTSSGSGNAFGYTAGQVSVEGLVASVPLLPRVLSGRTLVVEQVAQVDSKDMEDALWRALALRCAHWLAQDDVDGLVITHGTDTLEETAYFLHALLAPAKPVVLTCAMRPADALSADGPQNLLDAVVVACDAPARGVSVVCAGVVHGAEAVQKVHTWRLDAFDSGDAGPLAQVARATVFWARNPAPALARYGESAINSIANLSIWPRVEILASHAGARADTVRALVRDGVQGLIVAATGNGTLHHALEPALLEAQAAGVQVWRATRCANGGVLPGEDSPFPDAGALSPVKARIALQLQLAAVQQVS